MISEQATPSEDKLTIKIFKPQEETKWQEGGSADLFTGRIRTVEEPEIIQHMNKREITWRFRMAIEAFFFKHRKHNKKQDDIKYTWKLIPPHHQTSPLSKACT